jgi:hypothetical protein
MPHPREYGFVNKNTAALVGFLIFVAGCGAKTIYPVHGQLVDAEGKPLTELKGGAVEFDGGGSGTSANSSIAADGTFKLTTSHAGDGAHVGKHRVAITRAYIGPENPVPPIVETRYEKFETSGLEVTVEPKDNDVKLTLNRVKKR